MKRLVDYKIYISFQTDSQKDELLKEQERLVQERREKVEKWREGRKQREAKERAAAEDKDEKAAEEAEEAAHSTWNLEDEDDEDEISPQHITEFAVEELLKEEEKK